MNKHLIGILLLLGALISTGASAREPASPAAATRAFYAWYIGKQAKDVYPLLDDGIRTYVAARTVDGLRQAYRQNRLPGDADYFTKVQDYDERDWAAHIEAPSATMLGDVAVVPVTLGSAQRGSVVVFLRWEDRGWKITKVDDTRDYP